MTLSYVVPHISEACGVDLTLFTGPDRSTVTSPSSSTSVSCSVIPAGGFLLTPCFHLIGAVWCGPCKMISPHFEKAESSFENVQFVKVDVDEQPVSISLAFKLLSSHLRFPIDVRKSPRHGAFELCPLSWPLTRERRSEN